MSEQATTWLNTRERGSLLAIRLAFFLATRLGRAPMRLLVRVIALWYRLFDRAAVRASQDWLTRVHGRRPSFWECYRHLSVFAQVTLDRVFFLEGRVQSLVFTRTGAEHIQRQKATGRGAILLGAHLGSYEAMRAGGASEQVPIQILGYFKNARMLNALFEQLNPSMAAQVIHLGDDPVAVMSRVRARLEAGDFVGLLGDRVGLNDHVVRARFLGQDASFAAGPFLVASIMRCPVYLVFALYTEPNRYDLHCEPFAERIELPRAQRERALQAWVDRYAQRLEAYARRAPDNWFNWFDFWSSP